MVISDEKLEEIITFAAKAFSDTPGGLKEKRRAAWIAGIGIAIGPLASEALSTQPDNVSVTCNCLSPGHSEGCWNA